MYSIQLIDNIKRRNKGILDRLNDKTAIKFSILHREALKRGILLLYFSGYRDLDKQNELYQRYLRGEGGIAAKPGYSWHNYGRAVDLVPVKENGENDWNSPLYTTINTLGNLLGLKWMGWKDAPHFTDSQGETLEQVRKKGEVITTRKKISIIYIIGISLLALFIGSKILKIRE